MYEDASNMLYETMPILTEKRNKTCLTLNLAYLEGGSSTMSLKHYMTTSIIGSVQPELSLKVSMMTTITGFHPTLIRPKTNL
jgi:hypothetical protein